MSHDFYWTNRKRTVRRLISPGLDVRLRINEESRLENRLEANIFGHDLGGRIHYTAWYPIDQLFNGIEAWANGELIQVALKFASVDDREFIKTGTSPTDMK